jgi:hypothetical protein
MSLQGTPSSAAHHSLQFMPAAYMSPDAMLLLHPPQHCTARRKKSATFFRVCNFSLAFILGPYHNTCRRSYDAVSMKAECRDTLEAFDDAWI